MIWYVIIYYLSQMKSAHEFIEKLEKNNYVCSQEELKILVNFIKQGKEYRELKMKDVANQIKILKYADKYKINISKNYVDDCDNYCILFTIGIWNINFKIDFNNNELVTVTCESYPHANSWYSDEKFNYNQMIGNLSVDTIVFVLNLFKTHGKYVNINNPDIATLFNNTKSMKSARTIL